ncbi:hypothetical protein R3P38DRAFT_2785861 [Favolaschia claudopus]|uniref:Uncharacterized protein n=1 Tax=Favolaschia claudopus TaxID=2862362 RepID=A0AAW0AW66_9AGAR
MSRKGRIIVPMLRELSLRKYHDMGVAMGEGMERNFERIPNHSKAQNRLLPSQLRENVGAAVEITTATILSVRIIRLAHLFFTMGVRSSMIMQKPSGSAKTNPASEETTEQFKQIVDESEVEEGNVDGVQYDSEYTLEECSEYSDYENDVSAQC